jgi:small subunit ribosomal protein S16
MLAIRLQRVGRKGYPTYRVAVQESQRHPSSGRVVAYVGSYNPHTKEVTIQNEVAQKYLDNGAQPTPRVVKLLKDAGVTLPKWVKEFDAKQEGKLRNPEKLRKNQPKEEVVEEETPAEEPAAEEAATDAEA